MEDAIKWLKDFKVLFRKTTGLDYDNHRPEEYNEWYYKEFKEASKDDPYNREILSTAEMIIKEKNYPTLTTILENYDKLVKEKYYETELTDYPY